ncbi:hypothetical protein X975_02475, partial [Stegodyphus mimosarum]
MSHDVCKIISFCCTSDVPVEVNCIILKNLGSTGLITCACFSSSVSNKVIISFQTGRSFIDLTANKHTPKSRITILVFFVFTQNRKILNMHRDLF